MNASLIIPALIMACALAFSPASSDAAGDPKARGLSPTNPHTENGDCGICHVAPPDKLRRSWFVFASTKRELTADPNALCQKCHGVNFGHGIGKKPAVNHANLPLSADGTITCALTCHDMHVSAVDDPNQQRLHLRLPVVKLCLSCHDK